MKNTILGLLVAIMLFPAISMAATTTVDTVNVQESTLEEKKIQLLKQLISLLQLRIQQLIAIRDGLPVPTVLGISTSTPLFSTSTTTTVETPRKRSGGGGGGGSSRSSSNSNDSEETSTTTGNGTTATTTATSSIANLHDFQFLNGEDTSFTPEVENGWLASAYLNFDADSTILSLTLQLNEESDEALGYEVFEEFGLWIDGDKIATSSLNVASQTIRFTGLNVAVLEDVDTELVIGVDINDSDLLFETKTYSLSTTELEYTDANSFITTEGEFGDIGNDGLINFYILPDSIYATVVSLSDNKGNTYYQSQYNGQDSTWPSPWPELSLGETVTISVDVENSNSEPVLYQFNGTGFPNVWQEDNSVTVTIDNDTFNVETIHLRVFVRNSDTLYRAPHYDDMIQVFYTKSSSTAEPYDATLEFNSSSDNPDSAILVVDEDGKSNYTILAFELEAEEGPITIENAYIRVETPGGIASNIIDDSELIINGQVYDQDGIQAIEGDASAQLHMFRLDTVVATNTPLEIEFSVEFEGYDGVYTVPQEIFASIDLDTRSLWEAEGYDDLNPATDFLGTVLGETHTLFGAGLYLEDVDTNTELTTFDTGGSVGRFEIEFEATAIEDDFYFTDFATTSDTTNGLKFYIDRADTISAISAVVTSSADEESNGVYLIQEGETQTITLQVEIEASETGHFRIGLEDLFSTRNFDGVTDTQSTVIIEPSNFRTNYLVIIAE